MKKSLLLLAFFTCLVCACFSQGNKKEKNGSRVEALKIGYITKKLDLSSQEAQRFWPVYNKYMGEIRQVRQEQKERKLPELELEDKFLRIRKKYDTAFTKVLDAGKANAFFRAEKTFISYAQRELNERRKREN